MGETEQLIKTLEELKLIALTDNKEEAEQAKPEVKEEAKMELPVGSGATES